VPEFLPGILYFLSYILYIILSVAHAISLLDCTDKNYWVCDLVAAVAMKRDHDSLCSVLGILYFQNFLRISCSAMMRHLAVLTYLAINQVLHECLQLLQSLPFIGALSLCGPTRWSPQITAELLWRTALHVFFS
jgi:hypothetical protein